MVWRPVKSLALFKMELSHAMWRRKFFFLMRLGRKNMHAEFRVIVFFPMKSGLTSLFNELQSLIQLIWIKD
jgi:hypothetical protein